MNRNWMLCLLLVVSLFLAGCATGPQVPMVQTTTTSDVLKLLGPPDAVGKSAYGGETWTYSGTMTDTVYHFDGTGHLMARSGGLNASGRWILE